MWEQEKQKVVLEQVGSGKEEGFLAGFKVSASGMVLAMAQAWTSIEERYRKKTYLLE